MFIKNLKGFRNVRKSIETSGDISQSTLTHHISLKIRSPTSPQVHSGLLCKVFRKNEWYILQLALCIRSRNKMAVLGYAYVYRSRKQTLRVPPSAVRVAIPPTLVS